MQILLSLGAIFAPLILFLLRHRSFAWLFDLLAALSLLLANLSAGLSVLEIKQMNTEFTTHIHEVFNNWLFLGTLGYLGVYTVYRLLVTTAHNWQKRSTEAEARQ